MNILLIDPIWSIEQAFRKEGHTVEVLRFSGGVFHLPSLLARLRFSPDLVFQHEVLGARNYMGGLESIACPTVFWAIDSHLNMFWHQWYARLFDLVLTPHVSLFDSLHPNCRPKDVRRMAWPCQSRAFVPHAERSTDLGFCARVDEHRPIRSWMISLLAPEGLSHVNGLTNADMMQFYDHTRMIPNESISNEVNFRLMEGCSAGSLVLSPDVGEDQNALFEPGMEFLIYHDGLELLELARWGKKRPHEVEKIGRAAMRRAQAEHLPEHRARYVFDLLPSLSQNRLGGRTGHLALWLTLARQIRNGAMPLDRDEHAREGERLTRSVLELEHASEEELFLASQAIAQVLCLYGEGADRPVNPEKAFLLCRDILGALEKKARQGNEIPAEDNPLLALEVLSAASAFAIKEKRLNMALAFWGGCDEGSSKLPPKTIPELSALWAAALSKAGKLHDSGFRCILANGVLPESAIAWLLFARFHVPDCARYLASRFDSLLAGNQAYLSLALSCLAEHSLYEQQNWRIQLEYGLASLKACRVEGGLFELSEALKKARADGRERLFFSRLNAWRPDNRDWESILDKYGAL